MAGREATITLKVVDNFSQALSKFKTQMGQAGDAVTQAGDKAKTGKKFIGELSTEMKGMIAGIGIAGVINFAEGLNEIGTKANRAKEVMRQLTTEMGGLDTVMGNLRTATGGAIDDITLMESSNKLLLSGLASNGDELTKVIELATKLGGAMGEDAASSIENFSLMLLNQSIPRLDSFGISGSKVREEINELIRTGQAANREEAFKMAVFQQGAVALDKLGASANVSSTELGKLQVKLNQLMIQFGSGFATSIEAGAGMINLAESNDWHDIFVATLNAIESELTGKEIQGVERKQEAQAFMQSFATMTNAQKSFSDSIAETYTRMEETRKAVERYNGDALASADLMNDFTGTTNAANEALRLQEIAHSRAARAGEYQYNSMLANVIESQERAAETARLMGEVTPTWQDFYASAAQVEFGLNNMQTTTIAGNGITFTNPDDVSAIQADLETVNQQVERLAELNAQGYISDDDLAKAQAMADNFGRMADEAASMARDIKDLSLSELFGQGDGGQLAEAGSAIERLIGDADVAEAFNDAFGLASGAETSISQAFDSAIAPAIAAVAEQQGAQAATHYLESYLEAIRTGQMAGGTQGQIAGMGAGSVPFMMGADGALQPNAIFPQPEGGTTAFGMGESGAFDVTPFVEGMEMVQTAAEDISNTEIEVDTSQAEASVTQLDTLLQNIVNTSWSVMVDVVYNDPGAPTGSAGGSATDNARRNGGQPAGVDRRTPGIPMG